MGNNIAQGGGRNGLNPLQIFHSRHFFRMKSAVCFKISVTVFISPGNLSGKDQNCLQAPAAVLLQIPRSPELRLAVKQKIFSVVVHIMYHFPNRFMKAAFSNQHRQIIRIQPDPGIIFQLCHKLQLHISVTIQKQHSFCSGISKTNLSLMKYRRPAQVIYKYKNVLHPGNLIPYQGKLIGAVRKYRRSDLFLRNRFLLPQRDSHRPFSVRF